MTTPSGPLGGGQAEIEVAVKRWQDIYQREGAGTLEGRNAHTRATELAPILRSCNPQSVSHALNEIERLSPEILLRRALAVRALRTSPYYTLPELRDRVTSTLAALVRNKPSLVETGIATGGLEPCGWLSQWVSTYPEAASPLEGGNGDATADGLPFTKMKPERLQRVRAKLVDLKISILRELQGALDVGSCRGLWGRCLARLKEAYTDNQFRELEALDRKFAQKAYPWKPSGSYQGTLPDLLFLIGFFEAEASERLFDHTKIALERASFDPLEREYLEVLGDRNRDALDTALDAYGKNLNRQAEEFWPEFRDRVDRAVEEEFDRKIAFQTRMPGRYAEDARILMESMARVHREALAARGTFATAESLVLLTDTELAESRDRAYRYTGLVTLRCRGEGVGGLEVSLHGENHHLTNQLAVSFLHLLRRARLRPMNAFVQVGDLGVASPHQRMAQLKRALGVSGETLVENASGRGYRLSVHPRLIRYDIDELLAHTADEVKTQMQSVPKQLA